MMSDEEVDGEACKCISCGMEVLCEEIEAHLSGEHLDYFPYSCGYCNHFFTTDVLAHFHAKTKNHLPAKILKNTDVRKYKELWRLIEQSLERDEENQQTINTQTAESQTTRQQTQLTSPQPSEGQRSHSSAGPDLNQLCLTSEELSPKQVTADPKEANHKNKTKKGKNKLSFNPQFSQRATLPNGKVYQFMQCQQCFMEVCEAEISTHIFQAHVQWDNMIKCKYCNFQHSYNYAMVKQHILEAHPGAKLVIKDRRKGSKAQFLLQKWCKICFSGSVEHAPGKRAKSSDGSGPGGKKKREDTLERQLDGICRPVDVVESSNKSICQKCNQWILDTKIDEHVWLEHNDGELPYKCVQCHKSTITLDEMEMHWSKDHCIFSASSSTIEIIPNPSARPKFYIQKKECFPNQPVDPWSKIKIEQPDDDH